MQAVLLPALEQKKHHLYFNFMYYKYVYRNQPVGSSPIVHIDCASVSYRGQTSCRVCDHQLSLWPDSGSNGIHFAVSRFGQPEHTQRKCDPSTSEHERRSQGDALSSNSHKRRLQSVSSLSRQAPCLSTNRTSSTDLSKDSQTLHFNHLPKGSWPAGTT